MANKILLIQHIVHYIDDFMLLARSERVCEQQLNALLKLFELLGLPVAPHKIERSSQVMLLLGVLFNSITMTISLSQDRVEAILALLCCGWPHYRFAQRATVLDRHAQRCRTSCQ